jgi:hypothetical protein
MVRDGKAILDAGVAPIFQRLEIDKSIMVTTVAKLFQPRRRIAKSLGRRAGEPKKRVRRGLYTSNPIPPPQQRYQRGQQLAVSWGSGARPASHRSVRAPRKRTVRAPGLTVSSPISTLKEIRPEFSIRQLVGDDGLRHTRGPYCTVAGR